jgi:hypothetical protein
MLVPGSSVGSHSSTGREDHELVEVACELG